MRRGLPRVLTQPKPQAPAVPPPDYAWLKEHYIRFCEGPAHSHGEIVDELHELIHMPQITAISFVEKPGRFDLLLGISHVSITDPNTKRTHNIGEFIVTINRKGEERLKFENITRGIPITSNNLMPQGSYQHPHIPASGKICMTRGMDVLQEHIRNGKIYHAARIIVKALWTIDAVPYGPAALSHWPVKE